MVRARTGSPIPSCNTIGEVDVASFATTKRIDAPRLTPISRGGGEASPENSQTYSGQIRLSMSLQFKRSRHV